MLKCDFYEVLGVGCDVFECDIKKVYKCFVMKYYLDCNLGDVGVVEKFKEVKEVYEILIDVQKKVVYD